jgi:hypothetical protein
MSLEDRSRGEEHASATSKGAHMAAWGATSKGATDVAATRTTAVAAESMTAVAVESTTAVAAKRIDYRYTCCVAVHMFSCNRRGRDRLQLL